MFWEISDFEIYMIQLHISSIKGKNIEKSAVDVFELIVGRAPDCGRSY